jgi:hypothetical protein
MKSQILGHFRHADDTLNVFNKWLTDTKHVAWIEQYLPPTNFQLGI